MSYSVTRTLDFCYSHRLPNYEGKCRFLHGHNGHVEITISGEKTGEDGMVMDFGQIRSKIEAWVESELDHHTILFREDPLVKLLREAGQQVAVLEGMPTSENIASLICHQGRAMGLNVTRVAVWETARNQAVFYWNDDEDVSSISLE